jgi:hypothetical protein
MEFHFDGAYSDFLTINANSTSSSIFFDSKITDATNLPIFLA